MRMPCAWGVFAPSGSQASRPASCDGYGGSGVSGWLSDADWQEEVRCAALGLEGPNAKSFRAEVWAGQADLLRKARRENPEVFRCDDPEGKWIAEQERLADEEDERLAAEEEAAREERLRRVVASGSAGVTAPSAGSRAQQASTRACPTPFFAESEAELEERHRGYEFDPEPETPEETMRRVAAEIARSDRYEGFRG